MRLRTSGLLRRFFRHDEGSAIVEFSVLILPFALLVFAILESSLSFAGQQMLANATDDVARQYRTGQLRPDTPEKDKIVLRDFICGKIQMLVADKCPGLEVDLKIYDTFADAAGVRIPFKAGDLDVKDFEVEVGSSGSIHQLRVFYRWPVITDFMRKSMANLPDGKTLLYAMVTWQNEPFDD